MQLQTFKSQIEISLSKKLDDKIRMFLIRLQDHGEVQLYLKDGSEYSIHLGDMGVVDPCCVTFQDREGNIWVIMADSIVSAYTHLGSKEK